jgi:hypothetical protein
VSGHEHAAVDERSRPQGDGHVGRSCEDWLFEKKDLKVLNEMRGACDFDEAAVSDGA